MSTPVTPQATGPSASELVQEAPEPLPVPAAKAPSPLPAQEFGGVVAKTPNPVNSVPESEASSATPKKGGATTKKVKADPENLEQFIEYAYSRKGQRLTLKPKVEKQIAQNARLEDEALGRLLNLAKADVLLAVPRQILLLSQEVTGLPGLKASLTSFVSNLMQRHPVFGEAGVQGALRNLPEGLAVAEASARVVAFEFAPGESVEPPKGADLQEFRQNALRLFVTWLAINRGLNSEELSSLLFGAIWQPAAKDLADDNARLRALTDIGQAAGVGLACQRFHQQAIEARLRLDQAQREAAGLRDQLAAAESRLADTTAQLEAVQTALHVLRESSAAEIEALRRQHVIDMTHLQHELEQLRGRMVKRLTDSVEMLDVGLSALRKDTPRIPVMVERAEHVVDALRAEIQELGEE